MVDNLTFTDFAAWLREYRHVPVRTAITPETQFERDLGLTGDDGNDLLAATEKRFQVERSSEITGVRETFNLGPNEYLFHSEGFDFFRPYSVRKFTVGEPFDAVRKGKNASGQA